MPQKMTKQELRERLKARRDAISAETRAEADKKIVSLIAASPQFQNADLLLLYAPKGSELNLLPLVRIARAKKLPVAFPVCKTDTCTLEFHILAPDARLVPGEYGIPVPPEGAPQATVTERTLCILPGLAFAPDGARIGYGKGYYDRFLSNFPGVTVGALYQEMLCRTIPTEAHDLSASFLFTERGVICCAKHRKEEPETPSPSSRALLPTVASKLRTQIAKYTHKKEEPSTASLPQARPLHLPPLLVLGVFVLLIIARWIDAALLDRDSEAIGVILLQVIIFVIPAMLYSACKGETFTSRIRMTLPRFEHLWFCFCMLAVMITGSLLTCILTGGISSLTGGFTLYNTFTAQGGGNALDTAALIVAYALLPAFGEELIFRAYLCAEYEHLGVGVSITVSAVFFAMLHFSFPFLLTYLFLGALLAAALYATRSFVAVLALHFFYNLFCLFGQPYLSAFYVNAGSNDIFLFCLVTLFLLFAAFAVGEARKIYHVYALKNLSSDYTTSRPIKSLPKAAAVAIASPVSAACAVIWIVMSILDLIG